MSLIAFTAATRIAIVALQFLYIKLYSNLLKPEELGQFFLLISISALFNAIFLTPLDHYQQPIINKLIAQKKSIASYLYFSIKIVKFASFIIASLVCFNLLYEFKYTKILQYTISLSICIYMFNFLKGIHTNIGNIKIVSCYTMGELIVKVLLLYSLSEALYTSAHILAFYNIITFIILLIPLYLTTRNLYTSQAAVHSSHDYRKAFDFIYPIMVGAFINWIQLQSFRIILVPLGFAEEVGIYSTIAGIGSVALSTIASIYMQLKIQNVFNTNGKYIFKYINNFIMLAGIALILSVPLAAFFVPLLTNDNFSKYYLLVTIGASIELGNFVIGSTAVYLSLHNKTIMNINASLIGISSMLLTLLIMINNNDINVMTIGYPILISQIVTSVYMYYTVFSQYKTHA